MAAGDGTEAMSREELKRVLGEKAVKKGDFVLSSGKKSSYYVDLKLAYTEPEVLKSIAVEINALMKVHGIKAGKIAGIELGAVPILAALSMESKLPFLIVRKKEKVHGTKSRIEGNVKKGENIVIIEDVTTTGGSVLSCAEALKEAGLKCATAISVIDREEGAGEMLRKFNIELISLFKSKELGAG